MTPDLIQVLPAFVDEDGETWPPRVIWPLWAKLARDAGRFRVRAAEARRAAGTVALFCDLADVLEPRLERQSDWNTLSALADTMRDTARRTRCG